MKQHLIHKPKFSNNFHMNEYDRKPQYQLSRIIFQLEEILILI